MPSGAGGAGGAPDAFPGKTIPATRYGSGSLHVLDDGAHGPGVVCTNAADAVIAYDVPGDAEFGFFLLDVLYASEAPRPVDVYWNGALAVAGAMAARTGGAQICEQLAIVPLKPGTNKLEIRGASPRIEQFTLRPEIVIPATACNGASVRVLKDGRYGDDVIHTSGANAVIEYDIHCADTLVQLYQLDVVYAAEAPRPVDVYWNGALAAVGVLGAGAGGPAAPIREPVAVVCLEHGPNKLQLRPTNGASPHIHQIRLLPEIVIPAARYNGDSMNVVVDEAFGVGVVRTTAADAVVDYDIHSPYAQPHPFHLDVVYTAGEVRPVDVYWNGALVAPRAMATRTGGWRPATQIKDMLAFVTLTPGPNKLRIRVKQGASPHIQQFRLGFNESCDFK